MSCQNLETLFWTELIDLDLGLRGQVESGWIEEEQLDRDRILISKRKRPVQHTTDLRFYKFKE